MIPRISAASYSSRFVDTTALASGTRGTHGHVLADRWRDDRCQRDDTNVDTNVRRG